MINELIVLKINFQLDYNLHPMIETKKGRDGVNIEGREKFIKCMLWMVWSTGKIFAGQILRLEAVSRSLFLSSNFLLNELDKISKMTSEQCIQQLQNVLSEKKEYLLLLYQELITLQWIGHDTSMEKVKQELRQKINLSQKRFEQLDKVICSFLDSMALWRSLQKDLQENDYETDLLISMQMQKIFDEKLQLNFLGG